MDGQDVFFFKQKKQGVVGGRQGFVCCHLDKGCVHHVEFFFLLVFSLWIPPVVFEMMSATALPSFFAPSIKRRLTSFVGKK